MQDFRKDDNANPNMTLWRVLKKCVHILLETWDQTSCLSTLQTQYLEADSCSDVGFWEGLQHTGREGMGQHYLFGLQLSHPFHHPVFYLILHWSCNGCHQLNKSNIKAFLEETWHWTLEVITAGNEHRPPSSNMAMQVLIYWQRGHRNICSKELPADEVSASLIY